MEKFRIYSARNVFAPSSQAPSSSSSTAAPSTETDAHLLELRRRYLELQAELRSVADSCRDTDALLRDMRSALFTLRVGAQAFEEGDMDVAESMGEIAQNRNRLLELCAEANGKAACDHVAVDIVALLMIVCFGFSINCSIYGVRRGSQCHHRRQRGHGRIHTRDYYTSRRGNRNERR
jgi:hypothetical protein